MKILVKVSVLAVIVATLPSVRAQNVTQCLDSCLDQAAIATGCDLSSIQCVCTNFMFQEAALDCLQQNCTAQDVHNAESQFLRDCGEMHESASSLPSPSVTASSSLASSSSPSASTSASSSPSSLPSSEIPSTSSSHQTVSSTFLVTSIVTKSDDSTTTVTLTVVDPTTSSATTSLATSVALIPTPSLTTHTTSSSSLPTEFTTSRDMAAMYSSLVSPTPSTPSTGGDRLSTGAAVGIAVGSTAVAICLASASCWYIKRRRGRARWVRAVPFIARYDPQTLDARKGSSSSDPLLDGDSRNVLHIVEEGRTQTDGSVVARASFVGSESRVPSPCGVAHLARPQRASVVGISTSERLLLRGPGPGRRDSTVQTSGQASTNVWERVDVGSLPTSPQQGTEFRGR